VQGTAIAQISACRLAAEIDEDAGVRENNTLGQAMKSHLKLRQRRSTNGTWMPNSWIE
jgi:hypothetical protein